MVELGHLARRDVAAMLGFVVTELVLDARNPRFVTCSLARGDLPLIDALSDAGFLVMNPLQDFIDAPLTINISAIGVELVVELSLLTRSDLPAMLGFVVAELVLDASHPSFVSCSFTRGNLSFIDALIDARFLVVDPLLDLIDTRFLRLGGNPRGERNCQQNRGRQNRSTDLMLHNLFPQKMSNLQLICESATLSCPRLS